MASKQFGATEENGKTAWSHSIYTDGSATKAQSGWGFTVSKGRLGKLLRDGSRSHRGYSERIYTYRFEAKWTETTSTNNQIITEKRKMTSLHFSTRPGHTVVAAMHDNRWWMLIAIVKRRPQIISKTVEKENETVHIYSTYLHISKHYKHIFHV